MTEADLVPLQMHNALTAGPAPWTDTRVPAQVWHVARAVYGTESHSDEQRLYRTLQAALMTLAPPEPVALSQDAILDMAEGCTLQFHDLLEFARKVEHAHGIHPAALNPSP